MHHSYYPQTFLSRSNTLDRRSRQAQVMEVFGTGSVTATPDEAIISIGVRTSSKDVQEAVQENSSKITRIIQGLKNSGLSNEQIGTSSFDITPIYDYKDGTPHFVEYRVEHILDVRLMDATKAGSIYQIAVENGANIARELRFELSDPQPYYQRALTIALNHAIEKARSLSKQLSVQLNQVPIKITETGEQTPIPYYNSAVKFATTEVPIQPQQQVIKARIQAWFQYLST